jgi:hypothetical protein
MTSRLSPDIVSPHAFPCCVCSVDRSLPGPATSSAYRYDDRAITPSFCGPASRSAQEDRRSNRTDPQARPRLRLQIDSNVIGVGSDQYCSCSVAKWSR